jgi:hypothetical protein
VKKPTAAKPSALPSEAEEWAKNDWIKGWAAIDPLLKDIDLRPYVFVTRDKRGALGGLVAASHLEGLVERLMGPRMLARGAAGEVAKLTGPEPEEVFDAIRGRILQEDNFTKLPDGVQGLVVVVEAHPGLQRRLLEFLRELPVAKLGAWAVSSWGTAFTDATAKGEFAQIAAGWAEQCENTVLQVASRGVTKLKRT